MNGKQLVETTGGAPLTLGVIALGGRYTPRSVQAQDNPGEDKEASLVRVDFEIAPVPLNLAGRDHFNYAAGGNPYFGQATKTDPTT